MLSRLLIPCSERVVLFHSDLSRLQKMHERVESFLARSTGRSWREIASNLCVHSERTIEVVVESMSGHDG